MRFASTLGLAGATALAVVALGAASALGSRASAATTACGKVSLKESGTTYVYSVRRDRGQTTCRRARSIMRTYLVAGTYPKHWLCIRGHASQGQRWAASCASSAGALIRAFGPFKPA